MPIYLPSNPTGEQYEDFVTACLKTLGFFTETRVILREGGKEILELDIVATPLNGKSSDRELFEVKKTGLSFSNIFKLYGQKIYLNIDKACLVSLNVPEEKYFEIYKSKSEEIGIRIINLTLDTDTINNLASVQNKLSKSEIEKIISVNWFHQIAKRIAYSEFLKECNRNKTIDIYSRAKDYNFNISDSFFHSSALGRAESLYKAYLSYPRLTGEFVDFIASTEKIASRIVWNRLKDEYYYHWLQHLMMIENSSRVSIIKNALDDIVERGSSPVPTQKLKILNLEITIPIHWLPEKFNYGLEILRTHPFSLQLPFLFQIFIELFGGFIFFNDEDELLLMEKLTNIPTSEIIPSLKLLDYFFGSDGKSFFYTQKNQLLCLKMVPSFVRGTGCFLRQSIFGLKEYNEKYTDMGWLLSKWHNALYYLLEPFLKIESRK